MGNIPPFIADLGVVAVTLFLFVSAIYVIFRIIQTLRTNKIENQSGNGTQPRTPCFQSPVVQQLMSGQTVYLKAIERIEDDTKSISTNIALLTQLLERVAVVQEKLADMMALQRGTHHQ